MPVAQKRKATTQATPAAVPAKKPRANAKANPPPPPPTAASTLPPATKAQLEQQLDSALAFIKASRIEAKLPSPPRPAAAKPLLEQQLISTLDFIIASRVSLIRMLPSLRRLLDTRPGAVGAAMATQLHEDIRALHEGFDEAICNAKRSGVTFDDVSKTMMQFFPRIEKLAKLPGEGNLERAYGIAMLVKSASLGKLAGKGCGEGDRPSDKKGDEVLCKLLNQRVKAGEKWAWDRDLKSTEAQAQKLAKHDIEPFYEKFQAKLRGLIQKG